MTQSLKVNKIIPPSLILKCKTINTEKTSVNFSIEPLKGREAIKFVLIEIWRSFIRSHFLISSINTSVEDEKMLVAEL